MKAIHLLSLTLLTPLSAQHPLIPRPVSLQMQQGASYSLSSKTRITYQGEDVAAVAELLALSLRPGTGFPLPVVAAQGGDRGNIHLQLGEVARTQGLEAYQLLARENSVVLTGRTVASLINATQTLRQLLDPAIYDPRKQDSIKWIVPPVTIVDEPS